MSGQLKDQEEGVQGGTVDLDVFFRLSAGGSFSDDDGFAVSGTLPRVKIKDPDGVVVADSTAVVSPILPVRLEQGKYVYTRPIDQADVLSESWLIEWEITIGGRTITLSENFIVAEGGNIQFTDTDDFRRGFHFRNPVLTGHYLAPDWGELIHPDEMRYVNAFGNRLTSSDISQTITDDTLREYVSSAIGIFERELNLDILPRVIRHQDPIQPGDVGIVSEPVNQFNTTVLSGSSTSGQRIPRTDLETEDADFLSKLGPGKKAELYIREPGYPYRPPNARQYLFIKLRRRPMLEVLKVIMVDPVQNTSIDLMPWRREYTGPESRLSFFPNLTAVGNFPFIPAKLLQAQYPFPDFPDAILIDYKTGYLNAADVPKDLREAIRWLAMIYMLSDYGEGKTSAVASTSASLNSISESLSTTLSATSAAFGAKQLELIKRLDVWWKRNAKHYQRHFIGIL